MEDKLARKLVASLDRNSAALEQSNNLTATVLKASGHHPNYQTPPPEQRKVDPLTALIQGGAQ
jgi:hypothetical protein